MTGVGMVPEVGRALELLASGKELGRAQAAGVLELIMEGRVGEVQAAAFLMGLRTKGETADEIVGLAETMRRLAERVEVAEVEGLVDTCGTGGDGLGTFNISTTAAFVAAGSGARIAKHGNRGATSRSGSADLLEALGVQIDLPPAAVARCIEDAGIGFMFAPVHHRAMRHLVPVRRDLGIRTVFNFLGPLTNPAGARRQLIGVSDGGYVETLAEALARMGAVRALVVHGEEGLDEVSVCGPTRVVEVADGTVASSYCLTPEDLGFTRRSVEELRGGTPAENADMTKDVLEGREGAPLDITLANAAAALYVAGQADDLKDGVERARESIRSGRAREKVGALVAVSRKEALNT